MCTLLCTVSKPFILFPNCESLVSLPVWVISVDNWGQVLVILQASVVWHVKTEVLHQLFALNTSCIRAYAWSVYSCHHGILLHRHYMRSKNILKQSDACASRKEECRRMFTKKYCYLSTYYLSEKGPAWWKYYMEIHSLFRTTHSKTHVLWWRAIQENPKIGRFLKHNMYVSQGILLVLFCSLTAVVK